MNAAWQVAVVLALIGGLIWLATMLPRQARARGWHPEVARKIVHVGASGIAIPLPWIFPDDWPVWLLLGLALAAILAMRTPLLAGPGRALHSVERKSWGDALLVVAVGLVFLLHNDQPVLYVLPLLVVALGDAAAALTGSAYGRNFYLTQDGRKSVEGSAMFFLVTLILAMVCLLLLTGIGRPEVILVALGIAIFATVIEADSWRGFDNLFLPMGVLLFMWNLVARTGEAVTPAALPVLAMLLAFGLSRALDLSPQVSRIHAVALFLILAATDASNAVLPALALAIRAVVAASDPEDGDEGQTLDVVAGLAIVSFALLGLGVATGLTAINLFGVFCAAVAAAHAGRGLKRLGPAAGAAAGLAVAAALWGVWFLVAGHNAEASHWHGMLDPAAACVIAAAALIPVFRPALLRRGPAVRVTLLAALPVFGLYAASWIILASEAS